jgi:VWFA-related protein
MFLEVTMRPVRVVLMAVGAGAALVWLAGRSARVVEAADRTARFKAQVGSGAAPTIQVYSRETVVDVTVTDKDGKPVRGLTQADFTVSEDGKPQVVRSFKESRSDGPTVVAFPKLPAGVYTNVRPAAVGAANIILLDELNVDMMYQMRSREQAVKYVRSMPPGTQIALMAMTGSLRLLQGFTSDPEVLIAAINDPKNTMLQTGDVITEASRPNIRQNAMTLEELREVGAFVEGMKGRKNLIWFTVGIKQITDPNLRPPCQPDWLPPLHQAEAMLSASQVAVYSVDPRGLTQNSIAIAEDHLSMEAMAEATGGGAFYNTNDMAGSVGRAVQGGANYYTLSYMPPGQQYDGRHHSIHVKVERPGVQLVYRDEYYAEDPTKIAHAAVPTTLAATTPEPDKNTMKTSMARFAPVATQMLFDVKMVPTESAPRPTDPAVMGFPAAEVKGKPMVRYDILYSIPAKQLAFSDADGAYKGSVEFDVVASDVFGKLITSVSRTMPLTLSVFEYGEFVETPFQFLQQIDLPAGQMYVRVGVIDKVSNKVGTVEIPLSVAKGATALKAGR